MLENNSGSLSITPWISKPNLNFLFISFFFGGAGGHRKPRPNKKQLSFLHVYLFFNFRHYTSKKQLIIMLSLLGFDKYIKTIYLSSSYQRHSLQKTDEQVISCWVACLHALSTQIKNNHYRDYAASAKLFVPVKRLKVNFYELTNNARHAYLTIWLAVKSKSAP